MRGSYILRKQLHFLFLPRLLKVLAAHTESSACTKIRTFDWDTLGFLRNTRPERAHQQRQPEQLVFFFKILLFVPPSSSSFKFCCSSAAQSDAPVDSPPLLSFVAVDVLQRFQLLDQRLVLVLQHGHAVLQTLDVLLLFPAALTGRLSAQTQGK